MRQLQRESLSGVGEIRLLTAEQATARYGTRSLSGLFLDVVRQGCSGEVPAAAGGRASCSQDESSMTDAADGEPTSHRREAMHVNRPHHRPGPVAARTRACFVLLLLVLAACSGNQRDEGLAAEEETTVRVANRAWTDMTIYAIAGGQRVRLGSVSGSSTTVLRIPSRVVGFGRSLTFVADPLGSDRTSSSFEIFVHPGDEITLTIPAQAG